MAQYVVSQGAFDFSTPYSGSSQTPRHCSYEGAKDAAERVARQQLVLLTAYRTHGPLSDWQMHEKTGIERTTIIPRRRELMQRGLVDVVGIVAGPTGKANTTYGLSKGAKRMSDDEKNEPTTEEQPASAQGDGDAGEPQPAEDAAPATEGE